MSKVLCLFSANTRTGSRNKLYMLTQAQVNICAVSFRYGDVLCKVNEASSSFLPVLSCGISISTLVRATIPSRPAIMGLAKIDQVSPNQYLVVSDIV